MAPDVVVLADLFGQWLPPLSPHPLVAAIVADDPAMVAHLLHAGGDGFVSVLVRLPVGRIGPAGTVIESGPLLRTPLMLAAHFGSGRVADWLLMSAERRRSDPAVRSPSDGRSFADIREHRRRTAEAIEAYNTELTLLTMQPQRRSLLFFDYGPRRCVHGIDCCKFGDMCRYTHTPEESRFHLHVYRTKLCRHVGTASGCPSPERCAFAHTREELRTPSSDTALRTARTVIKANKM